MLTCQHADMLMAMLGYAIMPINARFSNCFENATACLNLNWTKTDKDIK